MGIFDKEINVESFLDGHNPLKYVVSIETDRYSSYGYCTVHDPETNKKTIQKIRYTPFLYMKDLPADLKAKFYKGDANYKNRMMTEHGISIKTLFTKDRNGKVIDRLQDGYRFLVTSSKSHNDITDFFRQGGINIYSNDLFYSISTNEQFMIDTGIRNFKGYDLYTDIHKLIFDIETTGLDPLENRCFMIGIMDNKGYKNVLVVDKDNDDEAEKKILTEFFEILHTVKPAIITGYHSENFDFEFILKRLELLGVDINTINTTILTDKHIKRKQSTVKFGGEVEQYTQTIMYGVNVIDTYFAVRRAKAINSDIKEAGLKYITKYAKANKKDRMYVEGEKIYQIWKENKLYVINKENNEYALIPDKFQKEAIECFENKTIPSSDLAIFLKEAQEISKNDFIYGKDIVNQYLLDDLWETQEVDRIYNESSYMISKWVATSFTRATTMGGSGTWNLIMTAWSYENGLAIPHKISKREFVGGISRTFRLGYFKNIVKGDFAGLYPSTQLEHDIFPKHDVMGILRQLLNYFRDTRNVFKAKAKDEKDPKLKNFYDAKQLPLKILNNSEFGWLSSIYSYWGDIDLGERVTCSGRQYLRKMGKFFVKYGFKPSTCDTDGINYIIPDKVYFDWEGKELVEPIEFDEVVFINNKGQEKKGLDAFFEKFNQDILASKYMKVDNDGYWVAGINIARKNYVSYEVDGEKEKLKLVGNSIKSSNLPKYIDEFFNKGLKDIIQNKPKDFVDLYYDNLTKIFCKQVTAINIASKAKVKMKVKNYVKEIYLPKIVKLLFGDILIKDVEIKKLKGFEDFGGEKDVDYYLNIEEYREKIFDFQKEKFEKLLKNAEKNDKFNKIKIEKYIQMINYVIKNNYHENEPIPDFVDLSKLMNKDTFIEEIRSIYENYLKDNILEAGSKIEQYFCINGNKNGAVKSQQIHMELIIENEKIVNLGDMIYYVNNGVKKSHGDSGIDGDGNHYAVLIEEDQFNKVVSYNMAKYISDFNESIEKFMICFNDNVAKTMLVEDPNDRQYFTDEDLQLISWDIDNYPYNIEDIDGLYKDSTSNVALFKMEDREVKFWNKIGVDPRTIFDDFLLPDKTILNDFPYYNKYIPLRERLKKEHEIDLKDINSRYEEGDVVLTMEGNNYFLSIYEKGLFHKEKQI